MGNSLEDILYKIWKWEEGKIRGFNQDGASKRSHDNNYYYIHRLTCRNPKFKFVMYTPS